MAYKLLLISSAPLQNLHHIRFLKKRWIWHCCRIKTYWTPFEISGTSSEKIESSVRDLWRWMVRLAMYIVAHCMAIVRSYFQIEIQHCSEVQQKVIQFTQPFLNCVTIDDIGEFKQCREWQKGNIRWVCLVVTWFGQLRDGIYLDTYYTEIRSRTTH